MEGGGLVLGRGFLILSLLLPLTSGLKCTYFENTGDENTEIVCGTQSGSCYALWNWNRTETELNSTTSTTSSTTGTTIIKQGCWESSPPSKCQRPNCTAVTGPSSGSEALFCCCDTDGCNTSPESVFDPALLEDQPVIEGQEGEGEASAAPHPALLFALTTAALLILILSTLLYWKLRSVKKLEKDSRDFHEATKKLLQVDTSAHNIISECVVLGNEIAHGKYGRVHNGRLSGRSVALKLYHPENRQFFNNEKWVYSQLSPHPNILTYFGWQEFGPNLVLVLDKVQPGNLRDLLQTQNPEIPECFKLLRGISAGLAFLHGQNPASLTVAHRDLTSRNVLVHADFRPVIADFGLSVTTQGPKYSFNGEARIAEFAALAEAGTTRYLAPEVLEGAVNLKDCENALKQADVYSLALLLWEIGNTSTGITLDNSQPYVLPYEIELGKDLSHEALVRYVVTRCGRPGFSRWRSSPLTRTLRDTLIEAWDEPDARLTAQCIQTRLSELRPESEPSLSSGTTPMTPLEPPLSNWTGRNPLMERNLYSVTDEGSAEYLIMSEKHGPAGTERSVDGSTVESQNTTQTDLSNTTIPYFNNLR